MAMIMRLAPFFPARILPGTAIDVARTGGSATISMTWDEIQQSSVPGDLTGSEFLLRDDAGAFSRVPAEEVIPPVVTWDTLSGKPSTFPPSAHTHPISDIELLQLSLDGKQGMDATLTALSGLDATAGLLEQTGADTFTKRALGVGASTSVLTRADGDGRYTTAVAGSIVQSALSRHVTFTSGTAAIAGGSDTIPQITDGFSIFNAAAFTPTSATNILRVTVMGQTIAGSAVFYWAGLFRDATAGAKATQLLGAAVGDTPSTISFVFEEVAGSTSATTFRLRLGNMNGASATLAVNGATAGRRLGGSSGVTILIEEIKV